MTQNRRLSRETHREPTRRRAAERMVLRSTRVDAVSALVNDDYDARTSFFDKEPISKHEIVRIQAPPTCGGRRSFIRMYQTLHLYRLVTVIPARGGCIMVVVIIEGPDAPPPRPTRAASPLFYQLCIYTGLVTVTPTREGLH